MKKFNRRYTRKYGSIISTHIQKNSREYAIASIIFVIGLLLGIVFVNNLGEEQVTEISTYLTSSITSLKENRRNKWISNFKGIYRKKHTNCSIIVAYRFNGNWTASSIFYSVF